MWNNFAQSPIEDETINNAFSSRGIFKICSDEEVQRYPNVQASLQNKKMVIAIDKSVILLEDEMVAKCSFLSFNAYIDVIAISSSGNLIVCGLNNGEIHGIFIKGIPLFNLCIKSEDINVNGKTFASVQQLGQRFYLCCTNGSVYRLNEIDESPLEANYNISIDDNETVTLDESILDYVTVQPLPSIRINGITDSVLIPQMSSVSADADNEELFIAGTHNAVHFMMLTKYNIKIDLPGKFGGVKRTFNLEHFIIILTNSGHLLEVCPFTKMIHFPENENNCGLIDEMIIMECSNENIEFLTLTKQVGVEARIMKIIEYPSFKCSSELEVSANPWLVQQPKCSVNLYYLSGQNLNVDKLPTEIEMMLISETHPSERFKKLIAKGHLAEAEDFGIQFELCLQPIYEAKAKRLLLEMSSLNNNNPIILEEVFAKLLEILKKIKNKSFFKNNRMFNIPSRKILEKFLKEILKHLDEESDEDDILEINEQIRRLETLSLIDPYECNMEWQKFVYNANLIKILIMLFKTDIPTACLQWKRHSHAIIPHLDEKELKKLLTAIPSNTEAFNLILWLRQFLPTISNTHPALMPFITDWSIEKTRTLQYAADWPEIGLEFITKVFEIYDDIKFMHSDVRRQHDRNIAKLRDLLHALQDLTVLQKRYNLIFTLDNYCQDSIDDTAFCILQRVHVDDLKSLVLDFLYPIFQEKGNTPVFAIKKYITMLVANRNSLSTWLERAVACIDLLHNEDDLLESALLVLQSSPVPWPDTAEPLLRLRNSTHPLAAQINAEYEIQVIKIMKVKYGWPVDSVSDLNLNLFLCRIIKMELPDMLNDICTLTNAAPEIATNANLYCCYRLVRNGKPDVAYEFFKILKSEKTAKHKDELVEFFADMLENDEFTHDADNVDQQKNLIEFYKLIIPHACPSAQKRLRNIQNRFTLKNKFGLKVNGVGELISYGDRLNLLESGMENIIERSQVSANVTKFFMDEVVSLCTALNIQKVYGICRIARRMRCLPLTCALCYATLEVVDCNDDNKDDVIELALELLAQQILQAQSSRHSSFPLSFHETDPLAFQLAYELLVNAALIKQKHPGDLVELIKYVQIVNSGYALNAIEKYYNNREEAVNEIICKALDAAAIISADTTLNYSLASSSMMETKHNKKRHSISIFDEVDVKPHQSQDEVNTTDQMSVVKFVARTLLVMVIDAEPQNHLLLKLRNILNDDLISNADNAREDFFLSLELMMKAKAHDVWYIVSQYLLDYQNQNKCKIVNSDLISAKSVRLFKNLMTHKDVNFIDLFVMLIADNRAATLMEKIETDLRTDQQKMNYLTLAEMYNTHVNDMEQVEMIRSKRIKHYYYMEFCKLNPSIKGKFNADIDNMEQLLKEFHNKQIDMRLLKRLSRDFGLDYQQILVTQVISILSAQEMEYEIKTDAFGVEELVMTTTAEGILSCCQQYINMIKNTELLTTKLKQFIGEINIYFYELYLCVIEILSFLETLSKEMQIWTRILHFLKHKMVRRRQNRPGQLETDAWLKSQVDVGVLPKIARYRLPFKPIVEQPLKDILESELSVDSCASWFPLIEMHTVLKGSGEIANVRDYFCMLVVKNSIGDYKAKNDTETWHLQPTNNAFLKSILRLVEHVQNPSKAFMILYFVANYAPEGADQVEASYECYNYAVANESQITDPKYQEQLQKIKRKYPILKTQHLLWVYGLTDESLMRLVENPTELIHKLYHHELILQSSKLDINIVAKEIAELHKLDIEAIQFQLLQKWLSFTKVSSGDVTGLEETFFEDQTVTENTNDDASNAAENVIRAKYILNSFPIKHALQFLVAHIFPSDGSVNTSNQLQVLECFSKINDGTASCNVLTQRHYITIKCVHELKRLGYNTTLDKFADCNKIDILKTIWQRNAQNPHTLEILANICLGFDIYLPKIWNGILKRMVMFQMVDKLNALVDALSCQPQLLNTDGLVAAWQYVLKHPFKNANQTRSFKQEELLHKALFRLQSCPVLHKLNLMEFAELSLNLERTHIAAVVMALCKNDDECSLIKQLICNREIRNTTRKEILSLEEAGILPVVLNFALKELNL